MTIGLYAGSFDPFTEGHAWMVEQARGLFEHFYIGIGVNATKGAAMFSMEERQEMILAVSRQRAWTNIHAVRLPEGLLVEHARNLGARCLVRGIRNADDLKEETAYQAYNHDIEPGVQTIYLIPPPELTKISSTAIKSLMKAGSGWPRFVRKYVPAPVLDALVAKSGA